MEPCTSVSKCITIMQRLTFWVHSVADFSKVNPTFSPLTAWNNLSYSCTHHCFKCPAAKQAAGLKSSPNLISASPYGTQGSGNIFFFSKYREDVYQKSHYGIAGQQCRGSMALTPKVMKGFVYYTFTLFWGKVESKEVLMSSWNAPEFTNAELLLFFK